MNDHLWPPPFPFPPQHREWNEPERMFLLELIQWRLQHVDGIEYLSKKEIDFLVNKLATPKASKRYLHTKKYAERNLQQHLTYVEWLDRVLFGYSSFVTFVESGAQNSSHSDNFETVLKNVVQRAYYKHYKCLPNKQQFDELIATLSLTTIESYFYDTELIPWLYTTARNIILSEGRHSANISIDTELTSEFSYPSHGPSGTYWLRSQIQHDAILEAIRNVSNQRYRIILLLIYVYEPDDAELATFFGVSISRIHTWKSRARKALRKNYYPPHLE